MRNYRMAHKGETKCTNCIHVVPEYLDAREVRHRMRCTLFGYLRPFVVAKKATCDAAKRSAEIVEEDNNG